MQDETDTNKIDPDFVVFRELLCDEDAEDNEEVESNLTLLHSASVRRKKERWVS